MSKGRHATTTEPNTSSPASKETSGSCNSSKYPNISYDTYVKAIICPSSEELKEFSKRAVKDTCYSCSRKHRHCFPDDADPLRCKTCQDRKQRCSWRQDFILEYTMRDLGLSAEEAQHRHMMIDYRSIRPNMSASLELIQERRRRERESFGLGPSLDSRKRKRPVSVSATSLTGTGAPLAALSLENEGSPSKRPKHGEDATKATHNQEGVQETIASTSGSSRPPKIFKKSKLHRPLLSGASPSRPSSKPVETPSSTGLLETPLFKSCPVAHLPSHAFVRERDDATHDRDHSTRNTLRVPMFLPLGSRSASTRESASAATSALTSKPAATEASLKEQAPAPSTEVVKADEPVSEEQHKEAMEIVLRKALEDQIAAKSALTRSEEENRQQAEEIKETRQSLEAMEREKSQLKSELDLKKTECEEWKIKADKFEKLAKKYSDHVGKLLKGLASEMGLNSEDTKSN